MDMMPPEQAGARVTRYLGGRKHVWPHPGAMGMGICALYGLGEMDGPGAGCHILGRPLFALLKVVL